MHSITKPKLYVLIGVPGSGKSTWANNQEWISECAYISTDVHVEAFAKEMGKAYSEVFNDVMSECVELMTTDVLVARQKKLDIVWDQTSTTIQSRQKKFRMLPNYHKIAVVFKTPAKDELLKRLAGRPGKTIPDEVIDSMIKSWEEPTLKEGFDEIWNT